MPNQIRHDGKITESNMFHFTKTTAVKTILIFFIFVLFFTNAVGILEIGWISKPDIFIQSNLDDQSDTASISNLQVFESAEFYWLIIIGTVLSILLPLLKPIGASVLTFFCMLPPFLLEYFGPTSNHFSTSNQPLIPMEYTLLMVFVLFVSNVLSSYFLEIREKKILLDRFSYFIPPELAEQMGNQNKAIDLTGEARNMTVFFTDLIDFTNISEQLNPKQLTLLLNAYFTEMTEILYQHGGTIDKYIGDSIMAFWNAPVLQSDHANRAIATALEMHKKINDLGIQFTKKGWPAPKMSIGINTGLMNVGNMGSKYRISYTVIGDAVNLASRIECLTRKYQVSSIVSESTQTAANDYLFRELDKVNIRGKKQKIKIYEPVCKRGEEDDELLTKLNNHNIALQYYYGHNMTEARKKFEALYLESDDLYYLTMIDLIDKTI